MEGERRALIRGVVGVCGEEGRGGSAGGEEGEEVVGDVVVEVGFVEEDVVGLVGGGGVRGGCFDGLGGGGTSRSCWRREETVSAASGVCLRLRRPVVAGVR